MDTQSAHHHHPLETALPRVIRVKELLNNAGTRERCACCGEDFRSDVGPAFLTEERSEPVCLDCVGKDAVEVVAYVSDELREAFDRHMRFGEPFPI